MKAIKENFFDKAVSVVNPVKAAKRMAARVALANAREFYNSGYSGGGASTEKRWAKGYNAESFSPQQDIDENLKTLRERSRDLEMNTPLGAATINTITTKTVGTGLYLKSCIDYEYLGLTQEEAEAWERHTEREFALWAESKECDYSRQHTFYEMQSLIMRGMASNGDGLGIVKYAPQTFKMPYELRLQIIESDRLCNPLANKEGINIINSTGVYGYNSDTGNHIVNGIEIDEDGRLVAYWICNRYPEDYTQLHLKQREWKRIEAFGKRTGNPNVLHLFKATRASAYRGVPVLAPVIETLKQLTRYSDAEIMAAVVSGMFSVFIKHNGASSENPFANPFADHFNGNAEEEETKRTNPAEVGIGNGAIVSLEEGEDVSIANPTRPNANYDGFIVALFKQIGAALEIPFEVLMKAFSSNYSASRAALLEAAETFKAYRTLLADDFCQPSYELFLCEAIAKGRIKAEGFFTDPLKRKAWCSAKWNSTSTVPVLDPVKEVTAAKMRCDEGFSTREQETVALNGGDFKTNAQQLERENALIARANAAKGVQVGTTNNTFVDLGGGQ